MSQCESGTQTLREHLHVFTYFLINYAGVMLGACDVLVAKHLADGFNGHAVHHGHRSGEGVPCDMKGQGFRDPTEVC